MIKNIIVIGSAGRMGKSINDLFVFFNEQKSTKLKLKIVAGIDQPPLVKKTPPFPVFSSLKDTLNALEEKDQLLDFIVDFSHHEASLLFLKEAKKLGIKIPFIIGTTGFSPQAEKKITDYAQFFPIVKSGNFSTGINVLMGIIQQGLNALGQDYEVEIVEQHHNQKKDAPSGTAKMLVKAVQNASGFSAHKPLSQREGIIGKRGKKEIGLFALRGGGMIGEHSVHLFSENDKITLTHTAFNRQAFSNGVIRAILFIIEKKITQGFYTMQEVLGLEK